ncbi:hypothetical protein BS78_03G091700 [Paspalum vaginatum]|nr:hypothetical protein BS78_03G091700 [Paspalum vaginatum]
MSLRLIDHHAWLLHGRSVDRPVQRSHLGSSSQGQQPGPSGQQRRRGERQRRAAPGPGRAVGPEPGVLRVERPGRGVVGGQAAGRRVPPPAAGRRRVVPAGRVRSGRVRRGRVPGRRLVPVRRRRAARGRHLGRRRRVVLRRRRGSVHGLRRRVVVRRRRARVHTRDAAGVPARVAVAALLVVPGGHADVPCCACAINLLLLADGTSSTNFLLATNLGVLGRVGLVQWRVEYMLLQLRLFSSLPGRVLCLYFYFSRRMNKIRGGGYNGRLSEWTSSSSSRLCSAPFSWFASWCHALMHAVFFSTSYAEQHLYLSLH